MTCARYADAEIAERYVLGQMEEADQAAFEEHFFGCDACFASVQTLQQMQAALRPAPAPLAEAPGAAAAAAAPAAGPGASTATVVRMPQPASAGTDAGRSAATAATSPARPSATASGPGRAAPPVQATGGGIGGISPTWWGLAVAASLLLGILWWQGRAASTPEPTTTIAQQQPSPAPSVTPPPVTPPPSSETPRAPAGSGAPTGTPPSTSPLTSPSTSPSPSTAPSSPRVEPGPARPARDLGALALVVPPPYVPLQTRGSADTQSQLFSAAMAKYNAKDYQGAAEALRALAGAQPDAAAAPSAGAPSAGAPSAGTTPSAGAGAPVTGQSAHVHFFLGVSLLMIDQPAEARQALDRAAASGIAPFADEAHFYLAKAALRERDLARAERELQIAVEREAGPAGDAVRLLREVRQIAR